MIPNKMLKIATRQSPLALQQAFLVQAKLTQYYPEIQTALLPLSTTGDQQLNHHAVMTKGYKGLFIKEIEQALLNNHADIAVHSMKDMPAESHDDLDTVAFLERDDPRDVFIALTAKTLFDVLPSSTIGTASIRRQSMINYYRPDVTTEILRGNINTRLAKLARQQYTGIILAAAGLHRLHLSHHIGSYFSVTQSVPAIHQGIIGIQCKKNNLAIKNLLCALNHLPTQLCLIAERALNKVLGGSCHSPIGGHAEIKNNMLYLTACVYGRKDMPDNKSIMTRITAEHSQLLDSLDSLVLDQNMLEKCETVGKIVAKSLLAKGAGDWLNNVT